jgi:hypothetical protein
MKQGNLASCSGATKSTIGSTPLDVSQPVVAQPPDCGRGTPISALQRFVSKESPRASRLSPLPLERMPSCESLGKGMKLFQKPDRDVQRRIARVFFNATGDLAEESLDQYFQYYEQELRLLRLGTAPSTWQAGHLAATDHEDIIEIVRALQQHRTEEKEVIQDKLSGRFPQADADCLERSIDLALRLWLLLNVRSLQFQSLRPLNSCIQWPPACTLNAFVRNLFPSSRWAVSAKESRLDVHFTAVAMVDICGIRIHWTPSLQDHLLLDRRHRILHIFPHKRVLELALGAE